MSNGLREAILLGVEPVPDNVDDIVKAVRDHLASEDVTRRVTHTLSEWLNDNAPIGEVHYRRPAESALREAGA